MAKQGLNIGWASGPVICLFIATYQNRYVFYSRFSTTTKKLYFEYRRGTLEDDCKAYSFRRGRITSEN